MREFLMRFFSEETVERIIKYLKYVPFVLIGMLIIILIASSILSDIHNISYWEAFTGGFSSLGKVGFWITIIVGSLAIYTLVFILPRTWRNYKKYRKQRRRKY